MCRVSLLAVHATDWRRSLLLLFVRWFSAQLSYWRHVELDTGTAVLEEKETDSQRERILNPNLKYDMSGKEPIVLVPQPSNDPNDPVSFCLNSVHSLEKVSDADSHILQLVGNPPEYAMLDVGVVQAPQPTTIIFKDNVEILMLDIKLHRTGHYGGETW